MRSPIEQARLQAQLLKKLLNDSKELLRSKKLLGTLQPHFGDERFQVFVAISDKGVIERNGSNPPELMKADRVVKEITEKSNNYQQTQGVKGFVKFVTSGGEEAKQLDKHHVGPFTVQEMELITDFLTSRCKGGAKEQRPNASEIPSRVAAKKEVASSKEANLTSPLTIKCDACGATDVEILYGRYGYYLQCPACETKKTVPQKCEVCDGKAKLRKKGTCVYRDCETCGTQNLLHTNPNPPPSS